MKRPFLTIAVFSFGFLLLLCEYDSRKTACAETDALTIAITAEGLSDPNFYKDRALAYDEALRDAKRQAIEKAVGCYVSSEMIVQNYELVKERITSKSEGFIQKITQKENIGVLEDGFYHVRIQADVLTKPLTLAIAKMSREDRIEMIRTRGNPGFTVAIQARYADGRVENCLVCNTEITDHLKKFGYKIVSPGLPGRIAEDRVKSLLDKGLQPELASRYFSRSSDVAITGQVMLSRSPTVKIAGIPVSTVLLTAWTLSAIDNHTAEVIFSRNFRPPKRKAYNNDQEALMDIGHKIGANFSKDVFKNYIMRPTHKILAIFSGITQRRLARKIKKDLLGLRSVLNVAFLQFLTGGESVFEVEFAGLREGFADILDEVVLAVLEKKYGRNSFAITEEYGNSVRIAVDISDQGIVAGYKHKSIPIQLLGDVPQGRFEEVVKSDALRAKFASE